MRGSRVSITTAMPGRAVSAMIMLVKNMNVSSVPMSAWNFSGENDQVETPSAKFNAVKNTPLPVSRIVS